MYMKKIIAGFLTVVLFITLVSNAAALNAVFPDIKDENLTREVAVLQMLGVISGDDKGNYVPNGTLTRASFCKMAVITMGRGDEEALYRNRTIFPDVRASHWARGYINLAVTGDKKIIMGTNAGTFKPDADISYAQAVTILMRMLGYTDTDAGMLWPDGYLALAQETGLTDGLTVASSDSPITRAQAAHLFCNLLRTPVKGGESYITTLGSTADDVVIMQLDVQASDGTTGAIRTSSGIFKPINGIVPPSILGLRGTLLKNTSGKILTFLPDENQQRTITASQTSASWIKDAAGVRYDISDAAPAYTAATTSTYGAVFVDIAAGMLVTLYFSADGEVESVYINTAEADSAVVVGEDTSSGSFSALTNGDTGYKIIKDGAPAALSDIRQYDVITYNSSAKVVNISDFRLAGCYEKSWPNMTSPSKITVIGHEFTVLPSAVDSLANYKVGQAVTFLFTSELQVAGAVAGTVGSTAVGIVQPGLTAASATVKLLNGLELSGNPSLSDEAAAQLTGELVTVSSYISGQIILNKLSGQVLAGDLDLIKGTLGDVLLSPATKVFERVGAGSVTQISLSELRQTKINTSKVLYARMDYAGRVDMLILNDVTGDRYTYGILTEGTISVPQEDFSLTQRTISVKNSHNTTGTEPVALIDLFTSGVPGGVVFSADGEYVEKIVILTEVKNVMRSAFYMRNDVWYVQINGAEYPVSNDVECYNSLGKTWFGTLNDARAFADTLTVYYDRGQSESGKIRMVASG